MGGGRWATASARTTDAVRAAPRWRQVAIGGAGLAIGAALGAWVMHARREAEVVTGPIVHVTTDDGLEIQPAISPDGKVIAYAAGTSLRTRLYLRSVSGGRTVPLTSDSVSVQEKPQWSPSGASLLFLSDGSVDTVAAGLGGGKPVTLISAAQGRVLTAAWSPDGRRIVFVRRDSVMTYTIATGEKHFVANHAAKQCVWSPDGNFIACTTPRDFAAIGFNMGNTGPSKITVAPVGGGDPVAISDSVSLNISPVWSPDGRRLYFVSNRDGQRDIYYVAIGRDGRAAGEIHRLTTALNAVSLSLSRDGRRLAYSVYTPQANIWSVPILPTGVATSAMATQVTFGHQLVESMSVTRDGKSLIYDGDRDGNSDLWRLTLGEREPEALTNDPVDEFGGELSPDGRRLVFYSYPEGSGRGVVWVKPMDGGPAQRVNKTGDYGIWPEWMPDGKEIAWGCPPRDVCIASEASAGEWTVRREEVSKARTNWSPDGRWNTNARRNVVGQMAAVDTVWLYPRESGTPRLLYVGQSTADPAFGNLQWSTDSRSLYFRHADADGRVSIYSLSIDGGAPRVVARLDDLTRPSYRPDFAVGGGRIYFTINDRQSDISVVQLIER
jgi:Tol biopolymer transport system component